MNKVLPFLAFAMLACGLKEPKPVEPVYFNEATPFEGETSLNVPDYVPPPVATPATVIDGGTATLPCCKLTFSIAVGDEPADATGTLKGEVEPLASGIALVKNGNRYEAAACFPSSYSAYYWYEFQWFSTDPNSGGILQGDGRYLVTQERYSPAETHYPTGAGTKRNFIPAVSNCSELGAETGP